MSDRIDRVVITGASSGIGVDVLVNNAGILGAKPFLEGTEETESA